MWWLWASYLTCSCPTSTLTVMYVDGVVVPLRNTTSRGMQKETFCQNFFSCLWELETFNKNLYLSCTTWPGTMKVASIVVLSICRCIGFFSSRHSKCRNGQHNGKINPRNYSLINGCKNLTCLWCSLHELICVLVTVMRIFLSKL